jgi:hypothetical protein
MARKRFLLGILALALVFGIMVVGCEEPKGNNQGLFVLTDIPETYNGKYAYFEAQNSNVYIMGCKSANVSTKTVTLIQISNSKVSLPMWNYSNDSVSEYTGNDTFTNTQGDKSGVAIFNSDTLTGESIAQISFQAITFDNGNAAKSSNDGTISTD